MLVNEFINALSNQDRTEKIVNVKEFNAKHYDLMVSRYRKGSDRMISDWCAGVLYKLDTHISVPFKQASTTHESGYRRNSLTSRLSRVAFMNGVDLASAIITPKPFTALSNYVITRRSLDFCLSAFDQCEDHSSKLPSGHIIRIKNP